MKQIIASFLLLVSFAFLSCTQEPISSTKQENSNDSKTNTMYSQNPYEYVGINHNQMTEAIYNILASQNIDSNIVNSSQFISIITQATIQAGNNTNLFPNLDYSSVYNTLMVFNLNWNNLTYLDSLAQFNINNYMSAKDGYYVNRIFNYLQNAYINGYELTTIQDTILNIESDILSQDWDSNEYHALKLIAQTKYSFNLAMSIFDGYNSINKNSKNKNSKNNNIILDVIKGHDCIRGCALCDAAGYIGGAAGGTVVAPGFGTVTGAVACGMAMSSTAYTVLSGINTVASWLGFK